MCQICKGETLCKNQFGPVSILKSGDEIFRIVTGSKLAAKRPLKDQNHSIHEQVFADISELKRSQELIFGHRRDHNFLFWGKNFFFRNIDFFIDFQLPINFDFSFEISNETKNSDFEFSKPFRVPCYVGCMRVIDMISSGDQG